MIKIPRRLRNTSRGQKRAALIWMAVTILLDQIWLRLITHYPTAAPTHMVRIGVGNTPFFTGILQASVHAGLLALCMGGCLALLFFRRKKPDGE